MSRSSATMLRSTRSSGQIRKFSSSPRDSNLPKARSGSATVCSLAIRTRTRSTNIQPMASSAFSERRAVTMASTLPNIVSRVQTALHSIQPAISFSINTATAASSGSKKTAARLFWPTNSKASGSTRRTISSIVRTARYSLPIRPLACRNSAMTNAKNYRSRACMLYIKAN